MTALLTPDQIYATAANLHEKHSEARCIAFQFHGSWTGPNQRDPFQFYHCESGLDVRAALNEPTEPECVKVILTPLTEKQLGEDVLVRLCKRRLHTLRRSDVLKGVFLASQIDPRITTISGLMEALVDSASTASYNPAATGSLSLEAAWGYVLRQILGFETDTPDLACLLEWSHSQQNLSRFRSLSEERRQLVLRRLGQVGAGAGEFCAILQSGYDPLSAALVCGVIYHADAAPSLHKAEGKVEDRFFRRILPTRDGVRRLAATAESLVRAAEIEPALNNAEQLLEELGAVDFAYLSPVLRSGYEQRLARLAHEMVEACRTPTNEAIRQVLASREQVRAHQLSAYDTQETGRIDMAVRLLSWNAKQEVAPPPQPRTLAQAAQEYVREGSFVDWARYSLIPGSRNRELERAYREICQRVDIQRELFAHQFARLLIGTTGSSVEKSLLPIEHVMSEIVAPLAARNPVLVLVIDGMSWPVWREVSVSLPETWALMAPGSIEPIALATIPSVTELSRCSLFCGTLRLGAADSEVKGFRSHPALTAVGRDNKPPLLLHKASLKSGGEAGLAEDVRNAIADKNRRVVGVVINAVDDNLLKGDQLVVDWSVDSVHPLAALLEEARLAARHVVVISDHGHVLEIGSEARAGDGGERWRLQGNVLEGEIRVEGPRVLTAEGNRVIAPWSDRIRYGPKRNGYHGGVSPQEMLIPVAVLFHESSQVPELTELVEQRPAWWEIAAEAVAKDSRPESVRTMPKVLFEESAPVPPKRATPPWLTALLKSPALKAQTELAGRRPLKREELTDLLLALTHGGGALTETALAKELKMARFRLGGFITIAQRMLNVEGYEVLSRDEESETVKLNAKLLKIQFELP